MLQHIKTSITALIIFTVICGIIYPLIVTALAQVLFHNQAQGSLIYSKEGKVLGSTLIGQNFNDPKYFWGRLSATSPAYNASFSSGSNLGPSNPALIDEVKGRVSALKAADPNNTHPVPVDLVTSSGSGLDPHISLAAAYYQMSRVAKVRGISRKTVKAMVDQNTNGRFLGLLGEPVVNVLRLNLALDNYKK